MRIISISTNFTSVVEMNILCNLLIFNYKNTEDIHFHNFFKGFLIPNSRFVKVICAKLQGKRCTFVVQYVPFCWVFCAPLLSVYMGRNNTTTLLYAILTLGRGKI